MKIGKKHREIKVILTCRNTIVFLFRRDNCPLVLQESNGIFVASSTQERSARISHFLFLV
ncbi:MAG: hypothetical protein EP148_01250 [Dialister invisus]|nr:hypothetical protein [Dialister invisus]